MSFENLAIDFDILSNDEAVALIHEAELHLIRCSETGQVVAEMSIESVVKSVEFEVFQNPTVSVEEIVDSMQVRWVIQSSRPAPHLTNFKTRDSMLYLRANHPLDVFAILLGRMLFESPRYLKTTSVSDARLQKLLWLTQLDKVKDELLGENLKKSFEDACDALIRMDAIHDVRKCLYSDIMRETAELIRDNDINLADLCAFVAHAESAALEALTKMNSAPMGNRMSISAASAIDIDGELVNAHNESEEDARRSNLRKIEQAQLFARQRSTGTVQVIRGKRAVTHLRDITGVIPQALADKYKTQAKGAKASKSPTESKSGKSGKQSKTEKALARFQGLNLDF
jgi:hypothetical protein